MLCYPLPLRAAHLKTAERALKLNEVGGRGHPSNAGEGQVVSSVQVSGGELFSRKGGEGREGREGGEGGEGGEGDEGGEGGEGRQAPSSSSEV